MAKNNSELQGIRKKLVAAIAMVLVACIMVVSSSYAWFTLSTAPEVKGIQTAVGSNGNLEMALITTGLSNTDITTSTEYHPFPEANKYWGNLVDLTEDEENPYGWDLITLAPARLSVVGNKVDSVAPLQIPQYGTDGRITGLDGATMYGQYVKEQGKFVNGTGLAGNPYGVRAIGVASGLTPAQQALNDARKLVRDAKNSAISGATYSLEVDAVNLANILVALKLKDTAPDTVSEADFLNVKQAVKNLSNIAAKLDEAMKATVVAVGVSQGTTIDPETVEITTNSITVNNVAVTWDESLDGLAASLKAAAGTLAGINADLRSAEGYLNIEPTDGKYNATAVTNALGAVLSTSDLMLGDVSLGNASEAEIIQAYFSGGLNFKIVSGIYHDIAFFTENYYTKTIKMNVDVTGVSQIPDGLAPDGVLPLEVTLATNANVDGVAFTDFYLPYYSNVLSTLKANDAAGDDTTGTALTTLYGYAVDLAFRTNAPSSNLLLETAGTSRVGEDTTAAVQGAGSYMEFTLDATNGYTLEQMVGLMDAIRVVLMDFQSGEIYAIAKLDMTPSAAAGDGGYVVSEDGTTVKAYLYLYEEEKVDDGEGNMVSTGNLVKKDTAVIREMPQNTAIGITALVYLDGEKVENKDVAINGNSMTGKMNLQFASSAVLEPMDYTFSTETTAPSQATTPTQATEPTTESQG